MKIHVYYFGVGFDLAFQPPQVSFNDSGKDVVEIQYWPEPEIPERCLQPPTKLTPAALRGRTDFTYVFLFIVDPGVKIVRFHPSPKRSQELIIDVPK